MGLFDFLGLGKAGERHLGVITFEGPGRLRLNANRTTGKRARRGAAAHEQTVGWVEFSPDGGRLDQGLGPAAGRLGAAEVTALLRDLATNPACQSVLRGLASGREHSSKVLSFEKWGHFGVGQGPADAADQPAG